MSAKFDIFKQIRDGTSIWITTVDGLEEARNRINRLAVVGPGDYLVYLEEKGLIVERVAKEQDGYQAQGCNQEAPSVCFNHFRFTPANFQEKAMENPNTQRRAIGLLVLFATVMTLIAIWNLPESER